MLSAAELQQVDAAVQEVRARYEPARQMAVAVRAKQAGWFSSLVTDAERFAADAAEKLGPQVETWATTRRRDVESGKRQDGSAYSLAAFLDQGAALASAAVLYTGEAVNNSAFAIVRQTAVATVEDAGNAVVAVVAEPWGWKAKAALAGVALVVVLVAGAPYVKALGKVTG